MNEARSRRNVTLHPIHSRVTWVICGVRVHAFLVYDRDHDHDRPQTSEKRCDCGTVLPVESTKLVAVDANSTLETLGVEVDLV